MDVADRAGLAEAFELVWEDGGGSQGALAGVGVAAAVDRLIAKGYLEEVDGQLRSCSCAVVRAQHRRSNLEGEILRLVEHVNARLEVDDLMYRELLAYAVHADQAEAALRSPEEQQATARRTIDARMSDRTPFDLRPVCVDEARRADLMRDDVDVYWESPVGEPVWVAGPEVAYGFLVRELLTNAISAISEREDQPGSVWLSLETGDVAATATLVVSDNGPGFPDDFLEAFAQRRPLDRPDRPTRGNGFHKLRKYAEAKGVHFELGRTADGGAVVKVYLPVVTGPNPRSAS
jgi:signal transduction histidine kinase